MKKLFLSLFLPWLMLSANAQFNLGYEFYDSLAVTKDGNVMANPWAGGLNTVQFFEIDLDNDSKKDLFVFEREGNLVRTFINEGVAGQVSYRHAPGYERYFPKELNNFAQLRDYDLDGKEDIFTYLPGGFQVFRNTSDTALQFTKTFHYPSTFYGTNENTPYVLPMDIAAIVDIDGDQDLDILSFGVGASEKTIEYHRNVSFDNYGHFDSLRFSVSTQCWGNVAEPNLSDSLIYQTCKGVVARGGAEERHAGSTMLVIDTDDDGDKDLILGDASKHNLLHITNNGDITGAALDVNTQDVSYPVNDVSVNLGVLPAAYYIDVDNDGTKDMIVAPNQVTDWSDTAANINNDWFYKNNGTNTLPDFELINKSFLGGGMLDVGTASVPVFFDVDGDSLFDILIGNEGYYTPAGVQPATLTYYRNSGTATQPAFEWVEDDYASLSNLALSKVIPTFGDLTGDGKSDMIIGDDEGFLHYFENTGTSSAASFTLTEVNFEGIDVSFNAAPFLFDINSDGRLDLVVGELYGILKYYENEGSTSVPKFDAIPTFDNFGGIKINNLFSGNSVPFITNQLDSTGKIYLMLGTIEGPIYVYEGLQNFSTDFILVDSLITNGIKTNVYAADVIADGQIDFIVGQNAGGVSFMSKKFDVGVGIRNVPTIISNATVYPNPASTSILVEYQLNQHAPMHIEVYDMLGRSMASINGVTPAQGTYQHRIDISNLQSGVYFVSLRSEGQSIVRKFVKTE